VVLSLRRYGGLDLDPGAAGVHQREEARRVNELDRSELDQVIQNALMDVLRACPRPFPRRSFPWLKNVLAHRALDHVHGEITESRQHLPYDEGIQYVLDSLLTGDGRGAGFFASPASPAHASWLSTWIFRKSLSSPTSMRPTLGRAPRVSRLSSVCLTASAR